LTIGVAVIGCGLVGQKRALALPAGLELRSVFDIDHRCAQEAADRVGGIVSVSESALDAMTKDGVHLVIVATPHHQLVPLALEAVRNHRHVLVEKPGGISLMAVRELSKAARDHKCRIRVGFNHRFHPALMKAHELLNESRYGRLLHIRARYGHGGRLGYEQEWRADPRISGGGELVDQGIHLIDLTRYLAGEVELAFAELRTAFWRITVEDNAYLALRIANRGFAWLHASWTEWKNLFSVEIVLEYAKIEISGLGGSYGPESLRLFEMGSEMGPPFVTGWEWPPGDESWSLELKDVLSDLLDSGASVGATIDDSIAAFQIIEDAYSQARGLGQQSTENPPVGS
jgi:predicted dehydrogenase